VLLKVAFVSIFVRWAKHFLVLPTLSYSCNIIYCRQHIVYKPFISISLGVNSHEYLVMKVFIVVFACALTLDLFNSMVHFLVVKESYRKQRQTCFKLVIPNKAFCFFIHNLSQCMNLLNIMMLAFFYDVMVSKKLQHSSLNLKA